MDTDYSLLSEDLSEIQEKMMEIFNNPQESYVFIYLTQYEEFLFGKLSTECLQYINIFGDKSITIIRKKAEDIIAMMEKIENLTFVIRKEDGNSLNVNLVNFNLVNGYVYN